jgi:MFS family permease
VTTPVTPARQPSGLTKNQTRSTIASLNWNTGLRTVFGTVSSPASFIFAAFALSIGVEKEQMGWIASMANAACLMQIAGLVVTNRVRNKKRMVVRLSMAEPLLLLLAIITIPFLPAAWRVFALVIATFASAALLNLTRPLSDDWTAAAIPAGLRESFMGRRSEILSVVGIAAILISGIAADKVGALGTNGLAFLLAIGAVIGIVAALPLRRAVLPSITARASISAADLKSVLQDRVFVRYFSVIMTINLPFFLATPYYQVFNLSVLKLNLTQIAFITVGYQVVKVLVSRMSAQWVSRLGIERMLTFNCVLYIVFFSCYIVAAAAGAWIIYVAWMIAAVADTVLNIAHVSAFYRILPHTPARSAYFAMYNIISLALAGLGAMVSIPILKWLKRFTFSFDGWTFSNFHYLFALATLIMIAATIAVRLSNLRLSEPRPETVGA